MAFCSQCGTRVEDDAQFCTACGAKIDHGNAAAPAAPQTENNQQNNTGDTGSTSGAKKNGSGYEKFIAYTDTTASYTKEDREQNRVVSVLSYLHILVVVPLIGMKESPFTQYHAKVGLNMLLWHLIAEFGGEILTGVLGWIPVIGWLVSLAVTLLNLALWAVNIFGIVSAAQGKARELEIMAPFKIIK
ncbi:MAG: zinc-ribbon domain-containing protein [Clostridia bacterium]|nr:zinc-ribbon domain-containing protein [Clostridia bacterium]